MASSRPPPPPAVLAVAVALALAALAATASAAVTYDRKAVVVNGQRRILLSGSIHYPRSVPEVRAPPPTPSVFFPRECRAAAPSVTLFFFLLVPVGACRCGRI
jgi:hypothetical protein